MGRYLKKIIQEFGSKIYIPKLDIQAFLLYDEVYSKVSNNFWHKIYIALVSSPYFNRAFLKFISTEKHLCNINLKVETGMYVEKINFKINWISGVEILE